MATGANDDYVKGYLDDCLREPVLHPDHPGHITADNRNELVELRSAMELLSGTNPQPIWPRVCGTLPADARFFKGVDVRLRKLKDTFDMWNPTDPNLSSRLDAFTVKGMPTLSSLLSDIHLKAEEKDGKAVRIVGLLLKNDDEEVDPQKARKFVIHLSSKLVTKEQVAQAYNAWLCMFHAQVEVVEEAATPAAQKLPPACTGAVHVYVEDKALTGGVPAQGFFPCDNTNTIYIGSQKFKHNGQEMPAIQHWGPNVVGILTHEVGHTFGFAHDHRGISSDGGKTAFVSLTPDAKEDPTSVMSYPKLQNDFSSKVSLLSGHDKQGCRALYNMTNDKVDDYPKHLASVPNQRKRQASLSPSPSSKRLASSSSSPSS